MCIRDRSENVKAQVEAAVPSVQKKYKNALQAAKAIEEKKTASQDEINNAMFELIEALQYLSFTCLLYTSTQRCRTTIMLLYHILG